MNRRQAIKTGLSFTSAVWGSEIAAATRSGNGKDRPNVLLIMSDQLNASALGCYGGWIPTPNLERLSQRAVRFNNATCTTPFCSPSRASLVTGLYPHSHGIVYNVDKIDYPAIVRMGGSPAAEQGITVNDITTEKILNHAGYQTHHYGKWHLSDTGGLPYYRDTYGEHIEYAQEMEPTFQQVRRLPRDQWMDWYDWALPVTLTAEYRKAAQARLAHWKEKHPQSVDEFTSKAGRLNFLVNQVFDYRVAERTLRSIHDAATQPFMITCSLNWPHDPNVAPSPYYDHFDPSRIKLPPNFSNPPEPRFANEVSRQVIAYMGGQAEAGLRELLRIYAACVSLVDDQVGRVLDALEKSGHADDTLVVFTADHGDMAGGHAMFWKSTSAFYDEIARVPLLIAYPGRVPPGTTEMAASLVDLMPTLLDFTGQTIPSGVQGHSLAPYLLGEKDPASAPAYTFCERVQANPQHTRRVAPNTPSSFMVRGQGWKLVTYPDGEDFLYHLAQDPGETRNVAHESAYQKQKAALHHELETWQARTQYPRG